MKTALRTFFVLSAPCLALAFSGVAQADCGTRHFYNRSDVPFRLSFEGHSTCNVGNAPMTKTCDIPPMQSAEIHYANVSVVRDLDFAARMGRSHTAEQVIVESGDGGRTISRRSFVIAIKDTSCYIKHPSDTGVLVMNDPADGDMAAECRFMCIANRMVMQAQMRRQAEAQRQQQAPQYVPPRQ